MRRSVLCGLIVWASLSPALAQELVHDLTLPNEGKFDNPGDQPKTIAVLDLKGPGVTTFQYSIEGEVRYENVRGKSYLEMWSWFGDGRKFFSRTLSNSGPTRDLEGSSDWRPFSLPFFSDAKNGVPTRILVNVVFAGQGTVHLRNLKLSRYCSGWWNDRNAGWIGAIGGTTIGLLGALVGTLGGFGIARRFVLTLTAALAGLGVVSLVIGLIALGLGQPYAVYYPLLLFGIILAAVCGGNLRPLRRRYEQMELRKMAAMDAGLTDSQRTQQP